MTRKGWYERNEIAKVTADWCKVNCKSVTERELKLLQIVNDRMLVRRDHLEIIHPDYRHISPESRVKVMNRSINKLFRLMCLDKIHEKAEIGKGNLPAIVAVDKAGSVLLNIPHKKRIKHEKKQLQSGDYIFRSLPPNYRHIHGINELEVQTILFCGEYDLGFKWRLEKDNHYKFYYNQQEIIVIPDVLMKFGTPKKIFTFWIEYDTGSENNRYTKNFPIIHEKLMKYRRFKSSKIWEQEFRSFPALLFITEDEKRVKYVEGKMKEIQIVGKAMHADEYASFLESMKDNL